MSQQLQAEVNQLKLTIEALSKRLEKLETPPPKQDKRRGKR